MAQEFTPVIFKEATGTLSGRELSEDEKKYSNQCKDVPCYRDGSVIVTQWTIGFWQRLKFLFIGKVSVVALGISQPPISLRIDNPFED